MGELFADVGVTSNTGLPISQAQIVQCEFCNLLTWDGGKLPVTVLGILVEPKDVRRKNCEKQI